MSQRVVSFAKQPKPGGFSKNQPQQEEVSMVDMQDIMQDIRFGANLNPDLFDRIAQEHAKAIDQDGNRQKHNKSTQLRKFYDELVMWHDKVFEHGLDREGREARYKECAPFIKMLCAKVAYAKAREHVSVGFEKFFTHIIRAIGSPETLKHAKLFVEAFLGFYKAEGR